VLQEDTKAAWPARRPCLKAVADLERLLGRITAERAMAAMLRPSADRSNKSPRLRRTLAATTRPLLATLCTQLDPLTDVASWIEAAIVDEPPLALQEGNLIKPGYNAELDRYQELVRGGRDWIATLQPTSARAPASAP
jgi:DNA mismatch repair protein MutS